MILGQKRKMFSRSAGSGGAAAPALLFPFMRVADSSSCDAGSDLPDGDDPSSLAACAACLLVWRVVIVVAGRRVVSRVPGCG